MSCAPQRRGSRSTRSAVAFAIAGLLAAAAPASAAPAYNFDFDFGQTQLSAPAGVAVDPSDGEVFVADGGRNRVVAFGATGTPARTFADGTDPSALAVSPVPPNDVYVADTTDNRVQRYTNAGALVAAFNTTTPRGIAFDPQGNVYVANPAGVTRFAPDGSSPATVRTDAFTSLGSSQAALLATNSDTNVAQLFGFDGAAGQRFHDGVLSAPAGIAADSGGNAFVADKGHKRVAGFDPNGVFVVSFGSPGSGEGQFQMPEGVAYSSFNHDVYVADTVNANVVAWKPIPPPVLDDSMDIQTDKGTVRYRQPGHAGFTKLTGVQRVRSGTIIDARKGTVGITSTTPAGQLQSADFYAGVFRAVQANGSRGVTEAQLFGGRFGLCPRGLRAAKVPQTIRKLWGSGAGKFRTQGRFAAASIRGTTWLTDDRCDGTLIRVTQGLVQVRALKTTQNIIVRAGKQVFIRAR